MLWCWSVKPKQAAFHAWATHIADPRVSLFCNVELEILCPALLTSLAESAARIAPACNVVLEVAERTLALRPAELAKAVALARSLGWTIALDNIGADANTVALLEFIRPDIVKLDISLTHGDILDSRALAGIGRYVQATGAQVVAVGIETTAHLAMAETLGATHGQGWLFGKPHRDPSPTPISTHNNSRFARLHPCGHPTGTPFELVADHTTGATHAELVALSISIETLAERGSSTAVLLASFERLEAPNNNTLRRYRRIAERAAFVSLFSSGSTSTSPPGRVRIGQVAENDPLADEWTVVLMSPENSVGLFAKETTPPGTPREHRRFQYGIQRDRMVVAEAAHRLFGRVSADAQMPKVNSLTSVGEKVWMRVATEPTERIW